MYEFKANNHLPKLWHIATYFDAKQLPNFQKPLALHVRTRLLIIHMPEATHLDHPN
jgi:hypothetical protein